MTSMAAASRARSDCSFIFPWFLKGLRKDVDRAVRRLRLNSTEHSFEGQPKKASALFALDLIGLLSERGPCLLGEVRDRPLLFGSCLCLFDVPSRRLALLLSRHTSSACHFRRVASPLFFKRRLRHPRIRPRGRVQNLARRVALRARVSRAAGLQQL